MSMKSRRLIAARPALAGCCARAPSGHTAEQRDELAASRCPMPPVLPTERIAHLGTALHPSSWAERDDRDHAADNFFQGGSPKTGHPISPPGPPHRQKSFYAKFPGDEAWMNFRFSRALPPGASRSRRTRGIPSDGRCRAGPLICLGRAGDACVVGALERVGDTLYGARVYVKLGRRLAHAHAARQSCSDSLSQLVRDRRPAKSFTFTLGPL